MRTTLDDQGRIIRAEFDDVADFIRQASLPRAWSGRRSSRKTEDPVWSGTDSFEHAVHLAKDGWPEGLAHLTEAFYASPAAHRSNRRYEVAGAYPVAARYVSGVPDCMVRRKRNTNPSRIIDMVVDIGRSAMTSSADIIRHGARILRMVDCIESAGCRVELILASYLQGDKVKCLFTVPLKRAEDPINLDSLAFWLINPSVQRRFRFGVQESDAGFNDSRNGYGGSVPVSRILPNQAGQRLTLPSANRTSIFRPDVEWAAWLADSGIEVDME